MNDANNNYKELWEAIAKEQKAKLEQLDAERKIERAKVLDEMKKEFDATVDWTEAKWDQFMARVSEWSNEE